MKRYYSVIIGIFVAGFLLLAMSTARAAEFSVSTSEELQDALDIAAANDENDYIYVLPGTYSGSFVYSSSESKYLTITGAGPDDAEILGADLWRALDIQIEEEAQADIVIEKLKFKNGKDAFSGGGVNVKWETDGYSTTVCTLTVRDCVFENNTAAKGGGLYAEYPVVALYNNTFRDNNIADEATGTLDRGGAGAHVISLDATIQYNEFSDNSSEDRCKGGGLFLKSEGQWITAASPKIVANLFKGNYIPDGSYGAGAYIFCINLQMPLQENALITHNRFMENTISGATGNGGGLYAATYSCYAPLTVVNNVFAGNEAQTAGAIELWPDTAPVILTNNTSYGNLSVDGQGDIILHDTMGSKIYNNILWNSASTPDIDLTSMGGYMAEFYNNCVSNYSFASDPLSSGYNIDVDPKLVEYRIIHTEEDPSPVVDAGDNNAPGLPGMDIEGEPRVIPSDGMVDIGADEFNPQRPYLWELKQTIITPVEYNSFGRAVALDKNILAVGAPFEGDTQQGAVYIFEKNPAGTWELAEKVMNETPGFEGHFGWSVAVDAEYRTLVVGEPDNSSGWAHIYRGNVTSGWELKKNIHYGGISYHHNEKFGYSVDISKNIAAIGIPFGGEITTGSVEVWKRGVSGEWVTLPGMLIDPYKDGWVPGGASEGEFGTSVAVSVARDPDGYTAEIVVGAPNHGYYKDDPFGFPWRDLYQSGAVYTFQGYAGWVVGFDDFQPVNQMGASRGVTDLGQALDSDMQTLVMSSDFFDYEGILGFFKKSESGTYWEGVSSQSFTGSEGVVSVAQDGDWAVAGLPVLSAGSARGKAIISYRYASGGTWTPLQTFSGEYEEVAFGYDVDISGNTMVVGDPSLGKIYIFEFPNPTIEIPAGYREVKVFPGLIVDMVDETVENVVHVYDYFNETNQNLICMLQAGSTFKIEAFGPDDDLGGEPRYETEESSAFPLELAIPDAEAGQWKFKVICSESKKDNPYTFAVLEQDQGGGGEEDTVPPEISLSVSPAVLWPPNHKMVPINVSVQVTDDNDPEPVVELLAITMDEGDETNTYDPEHDYTQGDGNTVNDIEVDGANILLRAERSGKGDGRVYTIIYKATDDSGNEATASAVVTVPHDIAD